MFLGKLRLSRPISVGGPRMPKNVRVMKWNDKSARITWDHSDDDSVLAYAVGYINVDLRSPEIYAAKDVAPNLREYVVQGLKPSTRYMFFVRGTNKIGRGQPSLLSNVIKTSKLQNIPGPTTGMFHLAVTF